MYILILVILQCRKPFSYLICRRKLQCSTVELWSTLEERVRKWVSEYSIVYGVTGSIFVNNIGANGENKVTVPRSYYKVIYSVKNGMIGLVLPNQSSAAKFNQFVVKVDDIEKQTDTNFSPGLDDKLENQPEGEIHAENLDFN